MNTVNARLLFWVPVLLRLTAIPLAALAVGYWYGLIPGVISFGVFCLVALLLQLRNLYRLSLWLQAPESRLPEGGGAWTDVFTRLYHLRRADQKNREELTEWLARFREAMSRLPDGVVIMDDVLFLEWCNPVAEQHLGLSLQRDAGLRVTTLVRTPEFIDYIVLGRYQEPLALRFRERKLIIHIIPFESRRQILVTQDVTAAERTDTLRRDFIANASHELRTPLTVINGFLEFAADPQLDAQTRAHHIRLMAEQGRRMQNLVDDMLALTRLESPDVQLPREPVAMQELLESVLAEGKALSGGRHRLQLVVDGPDILGSADDLRSAFSNLVSNAIRYTPEGGSISISWHRQEQGGALFSVCDTGIGIEPQHVARLTERFYRVDKARSRETRGTGLGLAIVKHVLLRHGAALQVESELGRGSCFRARFAPASVLAA